MMGVGHDIGHGCRVPLLSLRQLPRLWHQNRLIQEPSAHAMGSHSEAGKDEVMHNVRSTDLVKSLVTELLAGLHAASRYQC